MPRIAKTLFVLLLGVLGPTSLAWAGEADDLQRMIESARQGAKDLETLDVQQAVRDELTLMGVWLNTAWQLRAQQKYDEVRIVLDRVQAQGDMIRQKIIAS